MTGFDFAVIAILLVSLLLGWWRGWVCEVLSILGWPIAFVLSNIYADDLVRLVPMPASGHASTLRDTLNMPVAYVVVFIAVLIVWGVVVWFLSKLSKAIGLGLLDSVMGGLFGILRGGLVLLVLVWLTGMTSMPEQPFWREALTSKTLEDAALLTKPWLPDDIAKRVHYGPRS